MASICRLSIRDELTLKALDNDVLSKQFRAADSYVVDLTGLEFTTSAAAVNLLLLLAYLRQHGSAQTQLIPPQKPEVLSALGEMGFLALATAHCEIRGVNRIPQPLNSDALADRGRMQIRHIPFKANTYQITEWLDPRYIYDIQDKFARLGRNRVGYLGEVYIELCRNVFEHSNSFGYVSGQIDKQKQKLFITIGDLGIGIFKSLSRYFEQDREEKENRYGPLWDETKALDLAFVPGVSTKLGHTNAGLGLSTVFDAVREEGGYLVCRTERSKILVGYTKKGVVTNRKVNLKSFPGTQLEVGFPFDADRYQR